MVAEFLVKIPGASSGAFAKPILRHPIPHGILSQAPNPDQAEASFGVLDPLRIKRLDPLNQFSRN